MKKILLSLIISTAFSVLLPFTAWAATAELVSISNGAQDRSEWMEGGDAPAEARTFLFQGTIGEEYTAVFAVDEEPVVMVTPGADITEPWVYDATTGQVTVTIEQTELIGSEAPEDIDLFIIAVVFPVELGQDGPPLEAAGMWMSTNLTDWQMIPPSPEQETPQFGFRLTGPSGTTGFFHMFLPDGIVNLLSQFSGQTMDIQDLAVFVDDDQASMNITEIEGGAMIEIEVTFSEDATLVAETTSAYTRQALTALGKKITANITKEIVAKERLTVSLASEKYKVKKNGATELFGWTKNGKKGKKITLYAKEKEAKSFTKIASAKTKKGGQFVFTVNPAKQTTYKVKYKKSYSPVKTISIK